MPRSLLGLLLAAAAIVACAPDSCIDFDGQLVLVRRDAGRDRLDALFVYRNLHADTSAPAQALDQAERLRGGARWVALLGNFPFQCDLDSLLAGDNTAAAWVDMKRAILSNMLEDVCQRTGGEPLQDPELVRGIEIFARNEWSLAWHSGAITATVGNPTAPELRIETPAAGKEGVVSLTGALRERGWEISADDLDEAALAAWEAWLAAG